MRHFVIAAALFATTAAAQPAGLSPQERQQGGQLHPQLVQEFGGAMTGPTADYVRRVVQRVATQSGLASRPDDYTVTLLNSNQNNAFAIPGGYVYVTRQLLALMNDEAELAFVMGHEIGHVAARHSKKRQDRSNLANILAGVAGAVTGSDLVAQGAGALAQVTTLGYSREQERQADTLGLGYIVRAGYEPQASGDILAALGAQTSLESRLAGRGDGQVPGWLSTHPATGERVDRILKQAREVGRGGEVNRDAFLNAIDGLPYDDDPQQGVVQGGSFRHAGLNLAFDAPSGFTLANSPTKVTGRSAQDGGFEFAGGNGRNADLASYSRKLWADKGGQAPEIRTTRINGMEAAVSQLRASAQGRQVDALLVAYRWDPNTIFHIFALAPAGRAGVYQPLVESVRRLSPAEARGIRARRVQVVTVGRGDSVQSLAGRMAYTDDPVGRFATLNQIDPRQPLTPGSRVKLIVWR